MIQIRLEQPQDIAAIREVNLQAFGQPAEAGIVDNLRRNCDQLLSLVATQDDKIVGHILFSPAILETESSSIEGMGLAPMAVLPKYQRQGIGTQLVNAGLVILKKQNCPFIIVLGHADYYPRFGFEPASCYHILCEWDVPHEVFMILPLDKSILPETTALAKYRPEFAEAM